MDTKLTDFTPEQLAFIIVAVEEAQQAAAYAIAKHHVIGTNPESDHVKFWQKQVDLSIDWKVQLTMAMTVVNNREIIQSN